MTSKDAAQLKGELFGLEVLVMQSLCFIAAHTEDPIRHLRWMRDSAVAGISEEPRANILHRHLDVFQQAAADVVMRCVEAAEDVVAKGGVWPRGQGKTPNDG